MMMGTTLVRLREECQSCGRTSERVATLVLDTGAALRARIERSP